MIKLEKSKRLENVKYAIRGTLMEEAIKFEEEGEKILKLNIGNPAVFNFSAPHSILEDMKNNFEKSQGYSDSKGLKTAREAIIDYPLWTASVNLSGGKAVHYLCDEDNEWYPDINDIESKITKNTKGIIIINPNNPTGALYPVEVLKQIINIAKENNLIIFSDEIYDRLVFDDLQHISIASLSKEVPIKDYIDGLNLLSSMRLCSNVSGQSIIAAEIKDVESTKLLLKDGGRFGKIFRNV